MALEKIPSGNVCTLTENLVSCALALRACGADRHAVQWLIDNTGITMSFCAHLVEVRECGVEEDVINMILANVPAPGAATVKEYSAFVLIGATGALPLP